MAEHDDEPLPEGYQPPPGAAVLLAMGGEYTAPAGDGVALTMVGPPQPYQPPLGDEVVLNFSGEYEAPTGDTVGLTFAHAGWEPPSGGTVEVIIASTLSPPAHEILAEAALSITVASTLGAPQHSATVETDINVYRDPSRLASSVYEQAARVDRRIAAQYNQSQARRPQTSARYEQAARLDRRIAHHNRGLAAHRPRQGIAWEQAARMARRMAAANAYLPRLDGRWRMGYENAAPRAGGWGVANWFLPRARRRFGLPYEQASDILARHWEAPWQHGEPLHLRQCRRYEQATQPPPGVSTPPEPPEPPSPEPGDPFDPGPGDQIGLNFCRRLPVGTTLDLGVDPCGPAPEIPIQRTYLVSNSATLTLVATGQALEAAAISVAIDADSWAWELRATVIGEPSLALVRDAERPTELEAVINGHTWRVVLDDWRRDRAWGQMPAITLSARSLAAYLGAPHAAARSHTETQTRTAQQLAEQELPIGWTLDWQIDDWLVPPEAWHYTERTPIEAITAIATAAGAVVQAHPSQPELIVAPRYAVPHWAWDGAAPDLTLPPDILTRLGSEYRPSEPLNGVYVSGETTGVLALVKRTGTAGDRLAPMIVDPLTTEPAPARGRGIATLSATGEQTREALALPVAADLAGLLATGQLLRVDPDGDDWRGLVRAVSVNARLDGNGHRAALVVEQTAELERHLQEAS